MSNNLRKFLFFLLGSVSGLLISFNVMAGPGQGLFSDTNLAALKSNPGSLYSKVNACRLKSLLGEKDFKALSERMDRLSNEDDATGYVSISGGVKGLYTIMEGFVRLSEAGKVWIAYLEDGKIHYFTNDEASLNQPPTIISDWAKRFENVKWDNKLITVKPDSCQ